MDAKLDSLIEKIRKEGIEEAQQKAKALLAEAEKQAQALVAEAKKEAKKIIEEGKDQAIHFKQNAEADLRQAARDTQLLLKEKINGLLDNVFKKQVAEAMKPDLLNNLIIHLVNSWIDSGETEIVISENDKQDLEKLLFSGLQKEVQKSITIKVSSDINHGFRIGKKGGQVYYDFSADVIAEALKSMISPRLKSILELNHG